MTRRNTGEARTAILDASFRCFRANGYAATTVDELCATAGVTKGAFFHHFASKEDLGVAAVDHWSTVTSALFAAHDYHAHADPVDRVLAYLEFRKALVEGTAAEYSCVAGTMVQETHMSSPAIRGAADASIMGGVAHVEQYLAEALEAHGMDGLTPDGMTARSLALHVQVVIQGAFILAKARNDAQVARDSIDHLIRYIRALFGR